MPNFRRAYVPGGSFFFTVVVHRRRHLFADPPATALLGSVLRRCQMRWPFTVNAVVLPPDHLPAIWSLPPGDNEYPRRWGWTKKEFTQRWLAIGGRDYVVSEGRKHPRRRGIWQPRYWEHTLEDEDDFERHFDYIHWNPVKHGYVRCPGEWPQSSIQSPLLTASGNPTVGSMGASKDQTIRRTEMNPSNTKLRRKLKRRAFLTAAAFGPSAVLGVTGIAASAESQQNQSLTHWVPRVNMAHLPTLLEELPRLTKLVGGPRLLVKEGLFRKDETVLFWHTGGSPDLFVSEYADALV